MPPARVFYGGIIVHCTGSLATEFHTLTDTALGVDSQGKIVFVDTAADGAEEAAGKHGLVGAELITLKPTQLLTPGLVDTHSHAPQWENRGIGMDLPLLRWIATYTRPTEKTFVSTAEAERVYDMVVRDTLRNGTTSICYFGTLHVESTKILADKCLRYGQRGFVGQPSMDRSGLPDYTNSSPEDAVERSRSLIEHIRGFDAAQSAVTPIVTPGVAPSMSSECMKQLAALAQRENLPMQTHLAENDQEVEVMTCRYPDSKSYTHILDEHGLLTPRTILGHCVHLSDEEVQLIAERGCGVAHCPSSNINLGSGRCQVRRLLDAGVKVGLGCDCSGGHSANVLENLRRASDVSRSLVTPSSPRARLELHELFYMATLGGARVCGIEDRVGSFEVGKDFDAVLFDPAAGGASNIRLKDGEDPLHVFQKILFLSDDRNVAKVFVRGRLCVDPGETCRQPTYLGSEPWGPDP
jgi:guanine deaminase